MDQTSDLWIDIDIDGEHIPEFIKMLVLFPVWIAVLKARTEAMKTVCFCLFLLTASLVAAGPWTYVPDHEIYPLLDRNGVIHYLQAEMARTQGKGSWEILVAGKWIDASNIEPIRSDDDCDCNR